MEKAKSVVEALVTSALPHYCTRCERRVRCLGGYHVVMRIAGEGTVNGDLRSASLEMTELRCYGPFKLAAEVLPDAPPSRPGTVRL